MDPVVELRRRDGVARWTELERAHVSRGSLMEAVRVGAVARPHRGCFALPGTPRPVVLATIFRGRPACVTECITHDLPLFPKPATTHIAVPQSRGLGVVRERPRDEVTLHRVPVVPRLLADHIDLSALCVDPRQQLALVDAALHSGALSRRTLAAFRCGSAERRAWLNRLADPRAEAISETYARLELLEAGFAVDPQVSYGGAGRVDLVVEGAVVVELDGESYHSDPKAFANDRRRDRILAARGIPTLRYPFKDAVTDAAAIVTDVTAVMWRHGRLTPTVRTRLDAAARVSGWRALL